MLGNVEHNYNSAADSRGAEPRDLCRHCGRPLESPALQRAGFCCSGCRAVFHFIADQGLDYFYTLRSQGAAWSAEPVERPATTFSHFDDSKFAQSFIRTTNEGLARIELYLAGIHCAACVWLLEKLPELLPGLARLRVDLLRGRATADFDISVLKPSALARAVDALGYRPHPVTAGAAGKEADAADRAFALQLGVAAFCAMNIMVLFVGRYEGLFSGIEQRYEQFFAWVSLLLSIPPVFYSALPFYRTSVAGLRHRRLHIDLPIAIAVLGGFIASTINTILGRSEVYFDTVTALVFLLLCGRWLQRRAMKKVADTSELLYTLAPLSAEKLLPNGARAEVFAASLESGARVAVGEEQRFPCDGVVIDGAGAANMAILTGESAPVVLTPGSTVWAGTLNAGPELIVEVHAVGDTTRLGRLLADVGNSPARESPTARFIDRVSAYFVFGVLALAAFTFLLWWQAGFWIAWDHVIALLVVSCPCALGIATPITLSLASAYAGRSGILLRGADSLEQLAQIKRVVFDKTGTLTAGNLSVADSLIFAEGPDSAMLWCAVAELERKIDHPFARALCRYAENQGAQAAGFTALSVLAGRGVSGVDSQGMIWRVGSIRWLGSELGAFQESAFEFIDRNQRDGISVIGVARATKLLALFALGDTLRSESAAVVAALAERGIACEILSGDAGPVVAAAADKLKIARHDARGELTPEQKAAYIRDLGEQAAFVGDGVNDSLALAQSGVGIGISGGAEINLKVSDIFLTRPDLNLIPLAIDGARKTQRLIRQHLAISLVYNIGASVAAICGLIGPLAAALIMPASSLSVIVSLLMNAPFRGSAR